jgi:hypothetical protein
VVVVGPRENVFTYLPEIEWFETWPAALRVLSDPLNADPTTRDHFQLLNGEVST